MHACIHIDICIRKRPCDAADAHLAAEEAAEEDEDEDEDEEALLAAESISVLHFAISFSLLCSCSGVRAYPSLLPSHAYRFAGLE